MTFGEIRRRLRFWLTRHRLADELDEEMQLHLELRARANREQGLDADAAHAAARRRFGNPLVLREEGRDAWGFQSVERLAHDTRFAVRRLIKQRSVTLVAVATLALGVGANTAMFTLLNALLFRPAAASDPDRLVWIVARPNLTSRLQNLSYADYLVYRERTDLFAGVAAFATIRVALGGAEPERVPAIIASGNYFDLLGIQPQRGRLFNASDDVAPDAHPVVVLGDALWRRRFGGDPAVVGRTITVNGRPFSVIGVAPSGFAGLELAEQELPQLWVPVTMADPAIPNRAGLLTDPGEHWLQVVGRLNGGVALETAAAAVATISAQAPSQQIADRVARTAVVLPVAGALDPPNRAETMPVLLLLMLVPALVLIVASANVGNLLLASGLARRKELSLRRALGATRGRLVRQLLTESLLLSLGAAFVSIAVSVALTRIVGVLGRVPPVILAILQPDRRVFVATAVVALLSVCVFGLFPALSVTSDSLLPAIKDDSASVGIGGRRRRLRGAFVVSQVAVSVTLLITAGLFLQSLAKAVRADPGFVVRNVATLSYDLGLQGHSSEQRTAFNRLLLERVRGLPDVQSAALASTLPLGGIMWGTGVRTREMSEDAAVSTNFSNVSEHYFAALGLPLVQGRDFDDRDTRSSPKVVIVNETLARALWPAGNAIGQVLKLGEPAEPWREVVGIARDAKYDKLTESPRAFAYVPATQAPVPPMTLIVRMRGEPLPATPALVRAIHELDANLPLFRIATLQQILGQSVDLQRALSALLSVFGFLALCLAGLGIYGVIAQGVTLRTREIGIRMSLGARASQVLRMVVGEGLRLTCVGVLFGQLVSAIASRVLSTFLFGLRATDAATFGAGALVLCGVAIAASYVPARRAARVDPLQALRHE
jgi:putative ABC transport system permease protein